MKTYFFLACLAVSTSIFGQEVYLFDLNDLKITNGINISQNPDAYDNQPSFFSNYSILYASSRNEQTDILKYNIADGTKTWISSTLQGSEYSPLKIPKKEAISYIRLDTTGLQLLYQYTYDGESSVLIEDLVVGYHLWPTPNKILSFVLGDESTLVLTDLKTGKNKVLDQNIGRSLHKIPNSKLVSYITKQSDTWFIKSLNIKNGTSKTIIETLPDSEDFCWTPNGIMFMGKGKSLYKFDPKSDNVWILIKEFNQSGITRLAVSPDGKKLAVVFAE